MGAWEGSLGRVIPWAIAMDPMVTMNVIMYLIMVFIFALLFHIGDFLGERLVYCT